jgi:hypothetical protein
MSWICTCEIEHPDRVPVCASCLNERPSAATPAGAGDKPRCQYCGAAVDTRSALVVNERYACPECYRRQLVEAASRDPMPPEDVRRLIDDLAGRLKWPR